MRPGTGQNASFVLGGSIQYLGLSINRVIVVHRLLQQHSSSDGSPPLYSSSLTDSLLDAKEVVFSHLFRELLNSGDKGVLEVGRGEVEDVGEPGVLQGSNVVRVYPIVDIVQIALCMGREGV